MAFTLLLHWYYVFFYRIKTDFLSLITKCAIAITTGFLIFNYFYNRSWTAYPPISTFNLDEPALNLYEFQPTPTVNDVEVSIILFLYFLLFNINIILSELQKHRLLFTLIFIFLLGGLTIDIVF